MDDPWLVTYRSYTDVELTAARAALIAQANNPFISQTEGQRSYQRSTTDVAQKLAALTMVMNERSNTTPRHGVADFSEVRV